jgi:hypothetical protein
MRSTLNGNFAGFTKDMSGRSSYNQNVSGCKDTKLITNCPPLNLYCSLFFGFGGDFFAAARRQRSG